MASESKRIEIEVTGGKLENLFRELDYQEDVSGGDIRGSLRASFCAREGTREAARATAAPLSAGSRTRRTRNNALGVGSGRIPACGCDTTTPPLS